MAADRTDCGGILIEFARIRPPARSLAIAAAAAAAAAFGGGGGALLDTDLATRAAFYMPT